MKKEHPKLKVIPTRWVETNKSEIGEEPVMKSRIVVRGDLEDASQMRTDSPTCSQLMISTVFSLAACRDTDLWAGDISAAFLQGSTFDRVLVLKMPKGLPEDEGEGDYYMVSTTVYMGPRMDHVAGSRTCMQPWWTLAFDLFLMNKQPMS